MDGAFLELEMIDSGSETILPDPKMPSPGVGLRNTIDRLHTFYGDDYSFRLENTDNKGTRVYMRLPLEKQVI